MKWHIFTHTEADYESHGTKVLHRYEMEDDREGHLIDAAVEELSNQGHEIMQIVRDEPRGRDRRR